MSRLEQVHWEHPRRRVLLAIVLGVASNVLGAGCQSTRVLQEADRVPCTNGVADGSAKNGPSDEGAGDECEVGRCVVAELLSARGRPIGGTIAMVESRSQQTLVSARVDNMGRVLLRVPEYTGDLIMVLGSFGMIRNTDDEGYLRSAATKAAGGVLDTTPQVLSSVGPRHWSQQIEDLFGPDGHYGEEWSDPGVVVEKVGVGRERTILTTFGYEVDIVVRKGVPEKDGRIDFGSIVFPVARAFAEVEIRLHDERGGPFTMPLILGGWRSDWHTPSGNVVLPHMAMSQRGNVVRVILTRAGTRLLFEYPEDFLVLRPHDWSFPSFNVPVNRDALSPFPRTTFDLTVGPRLYRYERVMRRAPTEPRYWRYGEQGF